MPHYYIAWWNVENLFDVADAPDRPDWLARRLRGELQGWTEAVLARKIEQLTSIIRQMNEGRGPDVLGVCEVENRPVLDRLLEALGDLGRPYQAAHHDTSDQRGIDVAFIYDADLFTFEAQFSHVILKRTATRDLFQVNLRTQAGRDLVLVGNHWPARTAGVLETEPYRILAAETLSYWHERITEIKGSDCPVLVMGDFNDEPHDRSLVDYALSTRSRTKVMRARSPRLFNLMWSVLGATGGTFYYDYFPLVIDQFLVNKALLQEDSSIGVDRTSVRIEAFPATISGGAYADPIRFGRPSSAYNPDGYSDHFPIAVVLEEQD